ncbi:3-deoxy-D-manno-octulosonic acid transferase [Niabella insulamsoli]|uniref:3-deoxy-D-manno-octulosonic acid transferase n=1 Tax=Niabella insulamsoli TaxID=3144874 RepID=UPI0031FFE8C0
MPLLLPESEQDLDVFFYHIFLRIYQLGIRLASFFNPKAKRWIDGRKNIFDRMREELPPGGPIIWMHCASLGEFEQGRPVLEKLKADFPTHKIFLSFFSPSGYEVRKNYNGADWVYYLPLDTPANAKQFIEILKPQLVIFVKYEYWYNYLNELKRRHIPTLLISAIFRKDAIFFKWYGSLHRRMVRCFSHIFVQTDDSFHRIQTIVPPAKLTCAGDTRFDRVAAIAADFTPLPVIEKFLADNKNAFVIVAGSTWPEDETMLQRLFAGHQEIVLIIAPHEVDAEHIHMLKGGFPGAALYSEKEKNGASATMAQESKVLIIDNIGMLSRLYQYATVAYVGGGFNKSGIHNTLEAAVYGKPVVFGPHYQKFAEARGLIEQKAGISYATEAQFVKVMENFLSDPEWVSAYGANAKKFVSDNLGATDQILNWIRQTFA